MPPHPKNLLTALIVESLKTLIDNLSSGTSGVTTLEAADSYKRRIELIYRELLATEIVDGSLSETEDEALGYVVQAYDEMSNLVDMLVVRPVASRFCTLPEKWEGLHFRSLLSSSDPYIDNRFSVPQISQLLGVSIRTVRRRMSENNMSIRSTYSQLSDNQLEEVITDIQRLFPNCGNRQMYGHLISRGIRVQYHRVQETQSRVDPEGSVLRRLQIMRRRCYSVPGPQHYGTSMDTTS